MESSSQIIDLSGGSPSMSGRDVEAKRLREIFGKTTWFRERLIRSGWPILRRVGVASGRRNARKGVGSNQCIWA